MWPISIKPLTLTFLVAIRILWLNKLKNTLVMADFHYFEQSFLTTVILKIKGHSPSLNLTFWLWLYIIWLNFIQINSSSCYRVYRQIDTHTDIQTDRQIDRQTKVITISHHKICEGVINFIYIPQLKYKQFIISHCAKPLN